MVRQISMGHKRHTPVTGKTGMLWNGLRTGTVTLEQTAWRLAGDYKERCTRGSTLCRGGAAFQVCSPC